MGDREAFKAEAEMRLEAHLKMEKSQALRKPMREKITRAEADDLSSRLYQEHIVRMQNLQDRQRMKVIEEAQAIEEKRVGRSPASAGQKTPTGEGQRWETMYSEGHFLQTYKREVPEDYKPSEMKAVEVAREKHEREKAIRREFARSAHDLDYDQIKGKIDIEDIIQPGVAKTPEERKKKKEAE